VQQQRIVVLELKHLQTAAQARANLTTSVRSDADYYRFIQISSSVQSPKLSNRVLDLLPNAWFIQKREAFKMGGGEDS